MSGYYQGLLILVCINIIAVLGVSILTGFTRLFSFGNAGFMSIGAYTAAILSSNFHVPFLLSILAGAVLAAFIAFLLGKLTLNLQGDYFLIATLGFGESVRVLFNYIVPVTGGAQGFSGISVIPGNQLLTVAIITIVCIAIAWNIISSKFGRNIMAIREDEMAARAVGINTATYKNFAFTTSGFFAGIAGGLWAHYFTFISPLMFNLDKSAEMTIVVVIGGLGSLTGSIIASILVTVLPEILRAASEYRMLAYGIAVVLIINLWPSGLMGYKEFSFSWFRTLWVSTKTLVRKIGAK
jgi:branched-chain amino acid transport system permease protein